MNTGLRTRSVRWLWRVRRYPFTERNCASVHPETTSSADSIKSILLWSGHRWVYNFKIIRNERISCLAEDLHGTVSQKTSVLWCLVYCKISYLTAHHLLVLIIVQTVQSRRVPPRHVGRYMCSSRLLKLGTKRRLVVMLYPECDGRCQVRRWWPSGWFLRETGSRLVSDA